MSRDAREDGNQWPFELRRLKQQENLNKHQLKKRKKKLQKDPFSEYKMGAEMLLKGILFSFSIDAAMSLNCYVGLGNTAERNRQKVVECPEDKFYVCVKMFGGGMGDQIRRKCEKMDIPAFEKLLEHEAEKERLRSAGEEILSDPACFETTHHGRPVQVCHCSTDQCNGAALIESTLVLMLLALIFNMIEL